MTLLSAMIVVSNMILGQASPAAASGDDGFNRLTLVASDSEAKLSRFKPQKLELVDQKPPQVTKQPADLHAPKYGMLPTGASTGNATTTAGCLLILDEAEGKGARLFIDTNRNGDLTDDKPAEWNQVVVQAGDNTTSKQFRGNGWVNLGTAEQPINVRLVMYRFSSATPTAKTTIFFYRDYLYEGVVKIDGRPYRAILSDESASGDFRGKAEGSASGVVLLIDLNGDGALDGKDQVVDVRKVFRVNDLSYEVVEMAADGSKFRIVRTDKPVIGPTGLEVGQTIPSFERKTMDGKLVKFPEDYRGKIVLLDVWSTWCSECMEEAPRVVQAYERFHGQNLEILGLSMDHPNTEATVRETCKLNGLTWPHIWESQVWNSALVKQLGIQTMPSGFLVDGDSGEILAKNESLFKGKLEQTIQAAIDRKKKNAMK